MRTVAFYLPQFHEIEENNLWWGQGFTEWTNVRRARPQFEGHVQPREPTLLGQYDLTDPRIFERQTELAKANGVDAFCIYFYWFDGKRLLERPAETWRQNPELLPYCLSWANESWTRRWDGKDQEVLIAQTYIPGFARSLFDDLLPHFKAPHYLRHNGKPVFVTHRANAIPEPKAFADELRNLAKQAGLPGLHLVAAETVPGLRPQALGFDAIAEFPPVGANTLAVAQLSPLRGVSSDFRGRLMSYGRLARSYARRKTPSYVRYRGVMPAWDNTARRQQAATIYVGATPGAYSNWLESARKSESDLRGEHGLVFINAWNEWAEGAYLEPDAEHGLAYLDATRCAKDLYPAPDKRPSAIYWSWPQLRSLGLAAAGSLLALIRRVRNRRYAYEAKSDARQAAPTASKGSP